MSLKEKLLKNSTIKETSSLEKSEVFNNKDVIPTEIPAINIALSAHPEGGLSPGLFQIAGPSRHFKSAFALIMASAYLKKYDDAIMLFYDSEFGTPQSYFESLNIDMSRVIHTPITNIEDFKHDIMSQLENITRDDHVIIIVDSIGNLASKKEVDDALDGKTVVDMSRAKALKSLGRMITPHLTLKNIPMIAVNHVYQTLELFSKTVLGGGEGLFLSSDNIWIIGRQQEKDGTERIGYNFVINIEKSRHVREKSKIPINVTNKGGINKYSGLFDMASYCGIIRSPTKGYYTIPLNDTKYRRSDIEKNDEFFKWLLSNDDFKKYVHDTYSVSSTKLIEE